MLDTSLKHRPSTILLRNSEGIEILPFMKKSQDIGLKKLRFQSKCHWTPDKEQMFQELQQMKEKNNKL
jgi:hypothetical protein